MRLVVVACTFPPHALPHKRLVPPDRAVAGRPYAARGQPELITRDVAAWAAYLRGQADALDLPIVDTNTADVVAATDALEQLVLAIG